MACKSAGNESGGSMKASDIYIHAEWSKNSRVFPGTQINTNQKTLSPGTNKSIQTLYSQPIYRE